MIIQGVNEALHYFSVVCEEGSIRLRSGSSQYEGRLEICNRNSWGTVCDDGWSSKDAYVACKQLGYSAIGTIQFLLNHFSNVLLIGSRATRNSLYGPGTGPVHFTHFQCSGYENTLSECRYLADSGLCTHDEDAGVACEGNQLMGLLRNLCYEYSSLCSR